VNSPRIATPALSNAINAASILFNGSPKLTASFLSVIGPLTSSQPWAIFLNASSGDATFSLKPSGSCTGGLKETPPIASRIKSLRSAARDKRAVSVFSSCQTATVARAVVNQLVG